MTNTELRLKYNPDGSILRKAQLRMLEMLKFIDKVCQENNLTYWLDSGTLLGAARHQGFIPWDDDTDICMPREDALKLKKIMLHNNPSNEFVLQCHETDSNFLNGWYVLRDLKSEYIQDSRIHQLRRYRGLQVDIFPLEKNIVSRFHKFCILYQSRFINRLLNRENILINKMSHILFHFLYNLIIPTFRLIKVKNNYYKMSYGCPFNSKRYIDTIYPLKTLDFENNKFKVPYNTDEYLQKIYGNWQQIPNKIQTHNVDFLFY